MRTTLSLDDDLAVKLKSEARRSGLSFRSVVNDMLRRGLSSKSLLPADRSFKVKPKKLGAVRAGVSVDSIARLIDHIDGPLAR